MKKWREMIFGVKRTYTVKVYKPTLVSSDECGFTVNYNKDDYHYETVTVCEKPSKPWWERPMPPIELQ